MTFEEIFAMNGRVLDIILQWFKDLNWVFQIIGIILMIIIFWYVYNHLPIAPYRKDVK